MSTTPDEYTGSSTEGTPSVPTAFSVDNLPPVQARRRARVTTEHQWDLVCAELMPMYIERRTIAEIAEHFGISQNTARTWRNRLAEQLREEALSLQPLDYATKSMASIEMARAEAWKVYHESDEPHSKRAALYLVLGVENQSHKLGELIGFYGRADVMKDRTNRDSSVSHINDMMAEFLRYSPLEGHLEGTATETTVENQPVQADETDQTDEQDELLDVEPWDDEYDPDDDDQEPITPPNIPWSMA